VSLRRAKSGSSWDGASLPDLGGKLLGRAEQCTAATKLLRLAPHHRHKAPRRYPGRGKSETPPPAGRSRLQVAPCWPGPFCRLSRREGC